MANQKDELGHWMETYTGIKFYALNPSLDDIVIEDIAHALSNVCRFNGHTHFRYTVAQHSINVYKELTKRNCDVYTRLLGLLHDASEAYICDIPKPFKECLPEYQKIEEQLQNTIYKKILNRVPTKEEYKIVKEIDGIMLMHEGKHLIHNKTQWLVDVGDYSDYVIQELDSNTIKQEFLSIFNELIQEYNK